eukprot:Skav219372  [mRNA]  locus=scaffold76:644816:649645:- [translate_table: standard]
MVLTDKKVWEILHKHDILSPPDIYEKDIVNLLVLNPKKVDDQMMMGTVAEPPLPNIKSFPAATWKGFQPTKHVVIFPCDSDLQAEIYQCEHVLLFQFRFGPPDGIPVEATMRLIRTDESTIIPWNASSTSRFTMLDLCCGGYGGWSYAFKHAHENQWPFFHVIGIDHDLAATVQHALNHRTMLIPNQSLPCRWFVDKTGHVTAHADIKDLKFLQSLVLLNPEIWCFSFPCQSWNGISYSKGLLDPNGQTFVHGMGKARVMRPRLILLENVAKFPQHQQFAEVLQIIEWSGYRIITQGVYDAQDHLPILRPRWLALLQRIEDSPPNFTWKGWGKSEKITYDQWDAWIPTSPTQLHLFQLTPEHWKMYLDPALLPSFAPFKAKTNMMQYRMTPPGIKLPVFMACYGKHHELPESLIMSKGLCGHFTQEDGQPRWWKPNEQNLLQLQLDSTALLFPAPLTWHTLGNAIILPHAFLLTTNALAILYQAPADCDLKAQLQAMINNRMKASNVIHKFDGLAWYMLRSEDDPLPDLVRLMASEMNWENTKNPEIPADFYFDPDQGLLPINGFPEARTPVPPVSAITPTVPMHPQEDTHEDDKRTIDYRTDMDDLDETIPDASDSDHSITIIEPAQVPNEDAAEEHAFSLPAYLCFHSQPDQPPAVFPYAIPGTYGVLKPRDHFTLEQIAALWDGKLLPSTLLDQPPLTNQELTKSMQSPVQHALMIPANMIETPEDHVQVRSTPMVIFEGDAETHAVRVADQTWTQLQTVHPELADVFHCDYGIIPKDHVFTEAVRVFRTPMPIEPYCQYEAYLNAHDHVTQYMIEPPMADILCVHFEGQEEHILQIATFWKIAFSPAWQHNHGRQMAFQVINNEHIQFLFRPDGAKFATPVHMLKDQIITRLLLTAIASTEQTQQLSADMYDGPHYLGTIGIATVDQRERLLKTLRQAFRLIWTHHQPSLVVQARRIIEHTDVSKFRLRSNPDNLPRVKGQIIPPMVGGTGAKHDHRKAVHAKMANMLMELGMTLHDVPTVVDTLIKQHGLPAATQLSMVNGGDDSKAQLRQWCLDIKAPLPEKFTPLQKTQRKFQNIASKKQGRELRNLDISKYQIQPGFFLMSNQAEAPIHATFSPCVPGVTMVTPQQADPWLRSQKRILADELALFVVGDLPADVDLPHRITVPAKNVSGDTCLIAGYLLQLGEKEIGTLSSQAPKVETNDIRVCAFTLWSEDFSTEEWRKITQGPVRYATQMLERDGLSNVLHVPHGRSFRQGLKESSPAESTSVQFHAQIKVGHLRKVLHSSGYNGLYITPKSPQGGIAMEWRVIWTEMAPARLQAIALPHPPTAGMVRGKKGTFGIRVEAGHFTDVWKLFHPHESPPELRPVGSTWKLSPLPFGVDHTVLSEWGQANQWDIHPLRSLGARTWLVQASQAPRNQCLHFNGTPIIAKKLPDKVHTNAIGLIAGPMSKPTKEVKTSVSAESPYRLGDPYMDPWDNAVQQRMKNEIASASAATSSTSLPGPATAALQHQDQQLQNLESAFRTFKEEQIKQNKDVDAKLCNLDTRLVTQFEETKHAFSSFETTLNNALGNQDRKISATMEELKSLFLRVDKRKSPTEDEDEDDM